MYKINLELNDDELEILIATSFKDVPIGNDTIKTTLTYKIAVATMKTDFVAKHSDLCGWATYE